MPSYGKKWKPKEVQEDLFTALSNAERGLTRPQQELKKKRDESRLIYDGQKFDSLFEIDRYIFLTSLKQKGLIDTFTYHPPAFKDLVVNGVKIFQRYTADFAIRLLSGAWVYEDTKPGYIDPNLKGEALKKAKAFRASTERDTMPRIRLVKALYKVDVKIVYSSTEMPDEKYAVEEDETTLF